MTASTNVATGSAALPQDAPNAAQSDYWNTSPAAASWISLQADLDAQFAPLTRLVIDATAPKPGERILDIGCGCGDTSLLLAQAVAPGGEVVGLDISAPMLEIARQRAKDAGLANVSFAEADAQTAAFAPGHYDALSSRFGVMFFADSVAAFANMRKGLKSGGRLAFLCWRKPADNPILLAAYRETVELFPAPPAKTDPLAPGPFAFSDPERVRAILTDAGFTDIAITPHDAPLGGHPLERALTLSLRIGPLAGLLREQPSVSEEVTQAVRALLARHEGPNGVFLDSGTWIVTARAP